MKPHHYLAIAVRLASVFLAIYAIKQLVIFMLALIDGLAVPVVLSSAIVVIPIIAAVFLWKFPLTVARSIVSPELDNDIAPLKAQSILTTLLLGIGVYLAFYAVVDAIYWLSLSLLISSANDLTLSPGLSGDEQANMVATAFELALAFILIGKARAISSLLLRFAK